MTFIINVAHSYHLPNIDRFAYNGWRRIKEKLQGCRSHGPALNKGADDLLELRPPVNLKVEFTIDVWIRLPAAGLGPFRTLLSDGINSIVSVCLFIMQVVVCVDYMYGCLVYISV